MDAIYLGFRIFGMIALCAIAAHLLLELFVFPHTDAEARAHKEYAKRRDEVENWFREDEEK